MTRRRWIADEVNGDRAALVGEHAAHLARVLRAQVGQEFEVATGEVVRPGKITAISDERVEFALGAELSAKSLPRFTMLLAIFKFDRMEWAIEKCTETGVAEIIPVIAQRTDSYLAAAAVKRQERWRRIARQAAEQSRRAMPPDIAAPRQLRDAMGRDGLKIVLAESEEGATLAATLTKHRPEEGISLAIGPEGGWTGDEMGLFCGAAWIPVSLGQTILRAETAAIAATAIAISTLAELRRVRSAE